MEKLPVQKRNALSQMNSERLRSKLVDTGYDDNKLASLDRNSLLNLYAEYLLIKEPLDEVPSGLADDAEGSTEERSERELRLREQELQLRMRKMERQERKEERLERQKE